MRGTRTDRPSRYCGSVAARDLDVHVKGVAEAQARLLAKLTGDGVEALTDDHLARPSRLSGWTVGHVLAHVALQAEDAVRHLESGIHDSRRAPSGHRPEVLEAMARDGTDRHVDRIASTSHAVEQALSAAISRGDADEARLIDIALRRWREVEVHAGDLGLSDVGCDGPHCWSEDYIRQDLRVLSMQWKSRGSMGLTVFAESIARLDDRMRLAWLLGRLDVPGVAAAGLL